MIREFLKSMFTRDPYAGVLKATTDAYIPPRPLSVPVDMTDGERADLSVMHRQWMDDNKATAHSLDADASRHRPPAYCVEWQPEGQPPQHRISLISYAHAIQQGIDAPLMIRVRGQQVAINPMRADERAALSDTHRAFLDAQKAVCMMNRDRTRYIVKWRVGDDWMFYWSKASYADAIQRAIDAQPKQYDPRTPQLLALAHRVARLNVAAGEIGPGMLRQLVDEAVDALAGEQ